MVKKEVKRQAISREKKGMKITPIQKKVMSGKIK